MALSTGGLDLHKIVNRAKTLSYENVLLAMQSNFKLRFVFVFLINKYVNQSYKDEAQSTRCLLNLFSLLMQQHQIALGVCLFFLLCLSILWKTASFQLPSTSKHKDSWCWINKSLAQTTEKKKSQSTVFYIEGTFSNVHIFNEQL